MSEIWSPKYIEIIPGGASWPPKRESFPGPEDEHLSNNEFSSTAFITAVIKNINLQKYIRQDQHLMLILPNYYL